MTSSNKQSPKIVRFAHKVILPVVINLWRGAAPTIITFVVLLCIWLFCCSIGYILTYFKVPFIFNFGERLSIPAFEWGFQLIFICFVLIMLVIIGCIIFQAINNFIRKCKKLWSQWKNA